MKRTVMVMGFAIALTLPNMIHAQSTCGERETIVERLAAKWGEEFVGGGLQDANNIFEIWMSSEKGTWTILRTMANGRACVMATGTNWQVGIPADPKVAGVKS